MNRGKFYLRTGHKAQEEQHMYSFTHSLTLAVPGGGW
jgi:hypothetical protein